MAFDSHPWKRHLRIAAICAVVAMLSWPSNGSAVAQENGHESELDLPAMALVPADLEQVGLQGYAIGVGNLTPWEVEAFFVAGMLELDRIDVTGAFENAGADKVFKQFLDLYDDPEDPQGELLATVVSYTYIGADKSDAQKLFELMAGGAAATADRTLEDPQVGDGASLTFHRGEDPYTGLEATWVALHIHAGEDVVGVIVIDYAGGRPDEVATIELGEMLVERVAAVRAGEGSGLAPLALELQWDEEIGFPKAYYLQIDGETLPIAAPLASLGKYLETELDNQRRAKFFDRIGTVDIFFSHAGLRGGLEGGTQDYYFEVVLLRFEDESRAEEYIASLPDRFDDASDIEGLEQFDPLLSEGDEAVGFTYGKEYGVLLYHNAIYIRDADVVARVDVMGVAPIDDGAAVVAAAQAECLANDGCSEPLEAPDELRSND